jgi:metal-responsive CopG/Arc/MetJ family transcriptional regulator
VIISDETIAMGELVKVSLSLPSVLNGQIEEILERDQLGSKSGLLAELIRLGLERYCEGNNKILINLKMGRESDE